ncbi:hypothetical protein B0H12DRAFT_1230807 [Mycena haematopus]|nr:hypothetical protein B0H12DRAFT_1230807 [Mycena haematopus]
MVPSTEKLRLFPRHADPGTYLLCGWDVAICLTLFLQGVLCAQFAYYTNFSKRDSMWVKRFVGGLALITTLKASQCLAMMWIQNVTLFGNLEAASGMWETHWITKLNVSFEGVIAFYVQMFYCRRLWASGSGSMSLSVISRKAYIVVLCTALFWFAFVSSLLAERQTFFLLKNASRETTMGWIATHLGVVVGGDLLLTGNMLFWLLRSRVLSRGPTATILSSLLRLTSAAPTALCALMTFVIVIHLHAANTSAPVPMMLEFIAITVLPQLYAWSAMWTLNSREDINLAAKNSAYTYPIDLGTSADASPGS